MHWVWNHSQTRGNARLAMLYVADQVRTSACEAQVGQRELMAALNTRSRTTVEAVVKAAVKLGELEVVVVGAGRRPTSYRLPKAVGYVRPLPASALKTGPQTQEVEERSALKTGPQGSASALKTGPLQNDHESRSALKTGPQETRSALKTGPPPHNYVVVEEGPGRRPKRDAFAIIQPLVKALTEAGLTVSWGMPADDLLCVADAVERARVPAMVRFALDTKAATRQPIRFARYFVRGWAGLPPAATARDSPQTAAQPWCRDPDCDEISRTREIEDARGLRTAAPCPRCHPHRKESAA